MVSKEEEPKIDFKALEAITKKVLAYKPKKKQVETENDNARRSSSAIESSNQHC